jgi:hypothetical protein
MHKPKGDVAIGNVGPRSGDLSECTDVNTRVNKRIDRKEPVIVGKSRVRNLIIPESRERHHLIQ